MRAAALWAAYVSSILSTSVEDAETKFAALSSTEQAAWAAVEAASAPVTSSAPAPVPALKVL